MRLIARGKIGRKQLLTADFDKWTMYEAIILSSQKLSSELIQSPIKCV